MTDLSSGKDEFYLGKRLTNHVIHVKVNYLLWILMFDQQQLETQQFKTQLLNSDFRIISELYQCNILYLSINCTKRRKQFVKIHEYDTWISIFTFDF